MLVLASVTVVTLDFRGGGLFGDARSAVGSILSPIRRASASATRPVADFFEGLTRAGEIKAENERLRRENEGLRDRLDEAGNAAAQLEQLKQINDVPLPKNALQVVAEVFASGPTTFEWTIEIDAGSSRGVTRGLPVVSGDGLVGRIADVRGASSVVQLVTDPRFAVAARVGDTQDIGIASGHGNGPLTLDEFAPMVPVKKGARIFTAGGSRSSFPPDIPVGVVRDEVAPAATPSRTIAIDPLVRFSNLRFVKIIVPPPELPPAPSASPAPASPPPPPTVSPSPSPLVPVVTPTATTAVVDHG